MLWVKEDKTKKIEKEREKKSIMPVNNFFTAPKIQNELDVSFGHYSRSIMDADSTWSIL